MQNTPTIAAKPRERTGTRYSARLRKGGRLPAVIYGHKEGAVSVSVDELEMVNLLRHGAHLITVNVEGGKPETCLVKDLQFGFLGDNVIHLDLARVDLAEEVEVNVQIAFRGEAEGGKKPGAVVALTLGEIQIACRADSIPDEIRVDLDDMEGDVLLVSDLEIPDGVRVVTDPTAPVVQITIVQEEAEGEEVEAAEGAQPEVITEAAEEGKD
jgi:large subunit ribosomal protein L25